MTARRRGRSVVLGAAYLIGETYRHRRTGELVVVVDHEHTTGSPRRCTGRLIVRDAGCALLLLVDETDLQPLCRDDAPRLREPQRLPRNGPATASRNRR